MQRQLSTILIIDDDPSDQFLMQEAMKAVNFNYNLRQVSDGDDAIEYLYHRGRFSDQLKSPRPDLILLDLNMPRLHGRQVAQAIKSDPNLRNIPIIVLSTSAQDRDVEDLYDIGVNSYVQKPINFDEFTAMLHDLSSYWLERATLPSNRGR